MQKFISLGLGLIIASSLLVTALPASAAACPEDSANPSKDETFCNPSTFYVDFGEAKNNFAGLLTFVIEGLLGLVGLISIAFIVLGGFQYITSRGSEEQAETGKKTLTNAIIGLVIVVLSYTIVVVIVNALNKKF